MPPDDEDVRVKPQTLQGPASTEREVWIPLKDSHCRYHRKYFQAELGLQDTATRQHLHGLGTKPQGCIVTNLNLELRSIPKS